MALWTFYDSVSRERREELARYASFGNIGGGLLLTSEVLAACWAPFTEPRLRSCRRAEFVLKLPALLYDAFFNSPTGYRAQYAVSVELGRRKNRELIDALKAKLIASVDSKPDEEKFAISLESSAAKVWINERQVENHYWNDIPEIDYLPWRQRSENGAGLRAPLGTELVVYGGWLDSVGRERLDPYKLRRSEEIHEVGFT